MKNKNPRALQYSFRITVENELPVARYATAKIEWRDLEVLSILKRSNMGNLGLRDVGAFSNLFVYFSGLFGFIGPTLLNNDKHSFYIYFSFSYVMDFNVIIILINSYFIINVFLFFTWSVFS